jgi:polygalacturonase
MTVYDVKAFGAVGDGVVLDTLAIQRAIDAAAGGGCVVVPPGVYRIGTLRLTEPVSIEVRAGATLLGSSVMSDYPPPQECFVDAVGQQRGRCLIYVGRAEGVSIFGGGVIDGCGAEFRDGERFGHRPFLCRCVGASKLTVRDVTLRNSAAWVLHLMECDGVLVENVTIDSHVNENNDGIDIDSSSHVTIRGCDISTGDDSICLKSTTSRACENVTVSECTLASECGTIKIGTESYGDIRNIVVRDCHIRRAALGAIKIISTDGAHVSNVLIERIRAEDCTGPIMVRLGGRCRRYRETDPVRPPGVIRGVKILDLTAELCVPEGGGQNYFTKEAVGPLGFAGILVTGIPGHCVEDLQLSGIALTMPGGGGAGLRDRQVPEMVKDYPEHFYFGALPGAVVFARHVRGLEMTGVEVRVASEDGRPVVVCDDVRGVCMSHWRLNGRPVDDEQVLQRDLEPA